MKPLFFTIFYYCFFNYNADAQLTKGCWLTGGDASFKSITSSPHTSTGSTQSITEISPIIGYFFFDKFSAGLKADILFNHYSIGDPRITSNSSNYLFGPYLRYYFLNGDKIVNLLAEANYEYGISTIKNDGVSQKPSKYQQFTFMAGPAFFFTRSVALEFTVGYYYANEIGFNSGNRGFQMGLGFMIHLERDN
ncbi:MAG TPA: outer membrane beta-barrel protein [Hanamia sp.]